MQKLSDLIAKFQAEIKATPVNDRVVLGLLGMAVKKKAQELIGTHQIFWADLKPSTIERKQRAGQGKGGDASSPLYATGEFERSIKYTVVGQNIVEIFSNHENAKYHEWGTGRQAPRPVFKPAAKLAIREMLGKNMLSKFYLKSLR